MSAPDAVHRIDGTIPSGSSSVTVSAPNALNPEKTWVNLNFRPDPGTDSPSDCLCAYAFDGGPDIKVFRAGNSGDIDFHLEIVEFSGGVQVQHESFNFAHGDSQIDIAIDGIEKSKSFVMLWVTDLYDGGNTGWEGIRPYMVRAQIKDGGEAVRFERNSQATGFRDNNHNINVYYQVVTISTAFVQHGDETHTFSTTQWEIDDEVDLGRAFIVASIRSSFSTAGGGRVDTGTNDLFMFGGTGMTSTGALEGGNMHSWWQLVEVEDWYVEAVPVSVPSGSGTGESTYDFDLKAITNPESTIATYSNVIHPFVDYAGDGEGSRRFSTLEIVDENTFRFKTNDDGVEVDATAFAIQMEPRSISDTEPVILRNLQRKEVLIPEGQDQMDITIDDVVMDKTFVWLTVREALVSTSSPVAWVELTATDTVSVERISGINPAPEITVIVYAAEFESGVEVRRQWVSGHDPVLDDRIRKTVRTDFAEYAKSFIIAQHKQPIDANHAPSVAYTGSTVIRFMSRTSLVDGEHTHVQVVTLKDETLVRQKTVAIPDGEAIIDVTGLSEEFPQDARFMLLTRQFGSSQHEDDSYLEGGFLNATSFRLERSNTDERMWAQVFLVNTQNIDCLQGSFEMADGVQVADVDISKAFVVDNSGVIVPFNGHLGIGGRESFTRGANMEFTLKLIDPTTVRVERDESRKNVSGTFFVLGFQTSDPCVVDEPPLEAECPQGIDVDYPDCEAGADIGISAVDGGIQAQFTTC